jgi:hypothetical protein
MLISLKVGCLVSQHPLTIMLLPNLFSSLFLLVFINYTKEFYYISIHAYNVL